MSYTLLQLVDQVSGELGLTQPAAVIGSSNNQTIQLLALAQRLGKDLVRDYEWQRLVPLKVPTRLIRSGDSPNFLCRSQTTKLLSRS